MSGANSWLARQRKSDLVELAQTVGLTEYAIPDSHYTPPLFVEMQFFRGRN